MSTFNIDRLRQDGRTLLLSTRKTYSSSSSGVTGSQTLGARYSRSLRDAGSYTQGIQYSDAGASIALSDLVLAISSSRADSTDVSAAANTYLANARRASTEDQRGTIVFPTTLLRIKASTSLLEITSLSTFLPPPASETIQQLLFQTSGVSAPTASQMASQSIFT